MTNFTFYTFSVVPTDLSHKLHFARLALIREPGSGLSSMPSTRIKL